MSRLDDMIVMGRRLEDADTPYGFWGGGALELHAPMWVGASFTLADVMRSSANCTGVWNALLYLAGLQRVVPGGTPSWYDALRAGGKWEPFDPSKWYPCGTFLTDGGSWRGGKGEGHHGGVSRPNQLVLQSDSYYGVNEVKTASEQHGHWPWQIAGWLPWVPAAEGLPGWGAGGVEGYPGDTATPEATARWMGRVAERIYGLPKALPVLTSYVEIRQAWTGPGDVKDVPGYSEAVDHDSLGWFQQRPAAGWGTPAQITDAEYALSRFLDRALELAPDWPNHGRHATDPTALARWAQRVQVSAHPDRYLVLPDGTRPYQVAARLLGVDKPIVVPPKPKPEPSRPKPPAPMPPAQETPATDTQTPPDGAAPEPTARERVGELERRVENHGRRLRKLEGVDAPEGGAIGAGQIRAEPVSNAKIETTHVPSWGGGFAREGEWFDPPRRRRKRDALGKLSPAHEPAMWLAIAGFLVTALSRQFGLDLTPETQGEVGRLLAGLLAYVAAGIAVRQSVTPVARGPAGGEAGAR